MRSSEQVARLKTWESCYTAADNARRIIRAGVILETLFAFDRDCLCAGAAGLHFCASACGKP